MSKTGLGWLIIYVSGLGFAFVKGPIFGLLTYMFNFYTQFTWAKSASWTLGLWRWSYYAGIITLLSFFVKKRKLPKLSHLKMPQSKWLIMILVNMFFVSLFAADPVANKETIIEYVKVIIPYFLIIQIIRNKQNYKLFIWLQLLGNFLFGWQAYTGGKIKSGRLENIGGPGIRGSNQLATHMVMILPIIGSLVISGNRWEKLAAICTAPFILNALVLCNSRAGFMAIIAQVLVMLVFANKKMRKKIFVGLCLGAILFTSLAHEQFWARMGTIKTYEEDGSSTNRLESWAAGIRMVMDYPYGKGGDGFKTLSPLYIPEIVADHGGEERTIHNTYLMMATDWGIQGLAMLLLFYGHTLLELHKIRRRSGTSDDLFYHSESIAIETAIIGFLVAVIFGNRIYAEGLYWYSALAAVLSNIQQSELLDKNKNEEMS